ncbi:MAG TPA: UDP-N-acetylmuramoyl-tripeptide--D-alanyl-D-alanine ligase [Bacteroidales bacterium]
MEIQALYQIFLRFPTITTDSRNIPPDSVYVALKGDKFDGNTFVAQALEKGAQFAIIDNKNYLIDDRTILVENTLETLQKLANYHRLKLGLPIFAITGTNGKTTTKELIRSVLSKKYNVWATQGNLNNHIGVPLTLLSMTADTQIGVVEMGANHPFEIEQLCKIAEPDYGLITNIGKAHLEGFGGFQGVIKTKKELYDFLMTKEGTIFYNSDNPLLAEITENWNRKISYGPDSGIYCKGKILSANLYLKVEIEILHPQSNKNKFQVGTNLVGSYNFENILAATCAGLYFDVPVKEIQNALAQYVPTNNRSQLTNTGKNQLLLDCYNANPSSTEAAILNFSKIVSQDKIIILGDMLELGDEAESEHLKILKLLINYPETKVILVGSFYQSMAKSFGFPAFANSLELREWICENPITDSFLLIKGSRGIQLEKIIDVL